MHQISKMISMTLVRAAMSGLLIFAALFFISCYPGEPLITSDLDVVVTFFDKHADFSTKHTYAMPDSVIHIADSSEHSVDIGRQYDALILSEINKNMLEAGFTRITDPGTIKDADVFLLPNATATLYVGYDPYDWYYWDYWYPFPPGYGGWYPYYPSGTVYTYPVGTLFIDMVDPHNLDTTQKRVPSIWIAALKGLADGSVSNSTRITNGINQAFKQSPYLKDGK